MAGREGRHDSGLPSALKYRVLGNGEIAEQEHGRWSRAFQRWLQSSYPLLSLIANESISAPAPATPPGSDESADGQNSHSENSSEDDNATASDTADKDEADHLESLKRRLFGAGDGTAAQDGTGQLPTFPGSNGHAGTDYSLVY